MNKIGEYSVSKRDKKMGIGLIQRLTKPGTKIIALHRILSESQLEEGLIDTKEMVLSSAKFEQFVVEFLEEGGIFISLEEAIQETDRTIPSIAITVDDGYIDFYDVLYPIIKTYKIPVCLYVVTGFLDGLCFDSYGSLSHFVQKNDCHEFTLEEKHYRFSLSNKVKKKQALLPLNKMVESLLTTTDMKSAFSSVGIRLDKLPKKFTLNWDHIKRLNDDKLITIGSHSVTHPRMTTLPSKVARDELLCSKQRLESMLNIKVDHFAYPYGEYNAETVRLAKEVGYKSAASVEPGWLQNNSTSTFRLPRLWLDKDLHIVN